MLEIIKIGLPLPFILFYYLYFKSLFLLELHIVCLIWCFLATVHLVMCYYYSLSACSYIVPRMCVVLENRYLTFSLCSRRSLAHGTLQMLSRETKNHWWSMQFTDTVLRGQQLSYKDLIQPRLAHFGIFFFYKWYTIQEVICKTSHLTRKTVKWSVGIFLQIRWI